MDLLTPREARDPRLRPAAIVLGYAVLHALGVGLGASLVPDEVGTPALWPGMGLLLGALLLAQPRLWPALAAAALVARVGVAAALWQLDVIDGATLRHHAAHGIAVILGTVGTGHVIRMFAGDGVRSPRAGSIATIAAVGAAVGTSAAALVAAVTFALFDAELDTRFPWYLWWPADALGVLVFTPLVLTWAVQLRGAVRTPDPRRLAEGALIAAALIWLEVLIFRAAPGADTIWRPWMAVPPLLVIALRLSLLGTAHLTCVFALVAAWCSARGRGPFPATGPDATELNLSMQMFLGMTVGAVLVVATHFLEAKRRTAALRESAEELSRRVEDSTARIRRNELMLRAIFSETSAGIMIQDLQSGDLVDCNESAVKMLRGASRDDILTRPPAEFAPSSQPDGEPSEDAVRRHTAEALEKGNARYEWRVRRLDGTELTADVSLTPIDLVERTVMLAVVLDISDRKAAEDELRRAHASLEDRVRERTCELTEANGRLREEVSGRRRAEAAKASIEEQLLHAQKLDALGTLAAGIAHDFNNLVTAILGYVDILAETSREASPDRKAIEGIREAAAQAGAITRGLLTFSRKPHAELVVEDLVQLVAATLGVLQRALPASIEVETTLPETPLWVRGDASRLQQVVLNLVINARDAMPGGGALGIRLRDAGGYAELVIEDSGPGIPEELRERVFDPFFTTKSREQGTGLGLSIVQGIVVGHSGEVSLSESALGGTLVRVRLPLVEAPPVAAAPQTSRAAAGRSGTILLAEDDRQVRAMLATSLARCGYTVVQASDGEEALRRFRERGDEIDVAVLDVDLPRRSGIDCMREILKDSERAHVVLMSGLSQADLDADLATRVELLRKPFQIARLRAVVAEVLERTDHGRDASREP